MENSSLRSGREPVSRKPPSLVFALSLDEQRVNSSNTDRSDVDVLVLEILESTRCIRSRTKNQTVLAILEEIEGLAKSI